MKMKIKLQMYFTDIEVGNYYSVSWFTIWRWVREGKFPHPLKLSSGSSRWHRSDLGQHDEKVRRQNELVEV
jgi:predicted DNA-binding transcriptional regulator AlpA